MKIGIISLGLIGGSLLKALSDKNLEIFAVTRNQQTIENAQIYTPNISQDITTLKDCELIFVCSPMSKTLDILDALNHILKPTTIVTDVCSLKEFVTQKEYSYTFIGSHPMAGTEHNGFSASFAELFTEAKWVITPSSTTAQSDIEKLCKIIKLTGADIIQTTPVEHDKAVALISHMPMLIAQALVKNIKNEELAKQLASSGFRDTTRLALTNTQMANDMITMNSSNITNALIELLENAKDLLNTDYPKEIESIKKIRQNLYNTNGKNSYQKSN